MEFALETKKTQHSKAPWHSSLIGVRMENLPFSFIMEVNEVDCHKVGCRIKTVPL